MNSSLNCFLAIDDYYKQTSIKTPILVIENDEYYQNFQCYVNPNNNNTLFKIKETENK